MSKQHVSFNFTVSQSVAQVGSVKAKREQVKDDHGLSPKRAKKPNGKARHIEKLQDAASWKSADEQATSPPAANGGAARLAGKAGAAVQQTGAAKITLPSRNGPARIVGIYNFKGGVGKTSNVINLSAVLAKELKKKVLVVDADPQCDVTRFFLKRTFDNIGKSDGDDGTESDHDEAGAELEDDESAAGAGASSSDAFAEARSKYGGSAAEALDCLKRKPQYYQDGEYASLKNAIPYGCYKNLYELLIVAHDGTGQFKAPEVHEVAKVRDMGELFLIPGSPAIASLERGMAATRMHMPTMATTVIGSFRKLLVDTAENINADIVIVDFGPSLSPLHTNFLSSCDFIIPPIFLDSFSLASMHGLLSAVYEQIKTCKKEANDHLTDDRAAARAREGYALPDGLPKLMPFVVTNFSVKRKVPKKQSYFIRSVRAGLQAWASEQAKKNEASRLDILTLPPEHMFILLTKDLGSAHQCGHSVGYAPAVTHWLTAQMMREAGVQFDLGDVKRASKPASMRYARLSQLIFSICYGSSQEA